MHLLLEIGAILLVATAWAFAFAHAAEYPGKMRLGRDAYFKAQTIYYPGFTIGGASEPLAILALIALAASQPDRSLPFWLILLALAAVVATQLLFWFATQPVNRAWASMIDLGRLGASLFGSGRSAADDDWKRLRRQWEHSHLARAWTMTVAMIALTTAMVLR